MKTRLDDGAIEIDNSAGPVGQVRLAADNTAANVLDDCPRIIATRVSAEADSDKPRGRLYACPRLALSHGGLRYSLD